MNIYPHMRLKLPKNTFTIRFEHQLGRHHILKTMDALGDRYQIDELISKYAFTGREKAVAVQPLMVDYMYTGYWSEQMTERRPWLQVD